MTLGEIKKQYPQERVLVEYQRLDDQFQVKEGHILAHSVSKENIYEALAKTYGKNVTIEYTGSLAEELTVMFFIT